MKVVITSPVVVDIQEKQFAIEVNRLRDDPSKLSDFADGLCESVLAYLTSYYIGKLKTDHPNDFDKLARFMLGAKPEDEPVKKCPSGCTGNAKKKHEFKIGDVILWDVFGNGQYVKCTVTNLLKDETGKITKVVTNSRVPSIFGGYRNIAVDTPEKIYSLHGKCLYIVGYDGD